MKVILLKDIPGTGKKEQIIEVSDGYARNYLFPRKLAAEASATAVNAIKKAKAAEDHRETLRRQEAAQTAERLRGQEIRLSARAGEKGRLYGSITGQEVADTAMCSLGTVRRVCSRYHDEGFDAALSDKGWPGAKPKLNGDLEAKLTMLACSEPPAGHKRWTLRLLANQMVVLGYIDEVSHVTIAEWLKKTNSSLGS